MPPRTARTSNNRTALYRIYDDSDTLLYIGISKNFGVRWQKHACLQPWWPQVRRQTIRWYDSRDEALDAEALAIFTEQPRYNIMHRRHAQRLKAMRQQQNASYNRVSARPRGVCIDWRCPDLQLITRRRPC